MIIEYHRPDSIEDAISLVMRKDPPTVVMGGGLYLNEVVKDPQINRINFKNYTNYMILL